MIGKRIYHPEGPEPRPRNVELAPGEYCYLPRYNLWLACSPNGHMCTLGQGHPPDVKGSTHDIIEHADGSITVSPSILISNAECELWHGYLQAGVWRSC